MKAALVLLLVCAGAAGAEPQLTIAFRPQVQLAGAAVTLGEVAVLQSADLGLMRALVDLPIGRAPTLGQSVLLQRQAVADWIVRKAGVAAGQILWQGPEAVRVSMASRTVSGQAIAAVAGTTLQDWLAARVDRSDVQAMPPRDLEAPAGPIRLQPRPLADHPLRERMLVWVEVWAGERFVRAVPVAFRVAAWQPVPVASQRLEPGMPLPGDAIGLREVNVAALGFRPGTAAEQELRLRRPLAAGAVLPAAAVEAAPTVQRGQWATLHSGAGAVRTEARVEVLQDGRVGQAVRVRQAGATVVMATVTAPGRLEVAR